MKEKKKRERKIYLVRRKSGRRPGEASFPRVPADGSARLVAFQSQTGPDGHPFLVADVVSLSRALAAGAVLSEAETEADTQRARRRVLRSHFDGVSIIRKL